MLPLGLRALKIECQALGLCASRCSRRNSTDKGLAGCPLALFHKLLRSNTTHSAGKNFDDAIIDLESVVHGLTECLLCSVSPAWPCS
mmetsp:Transcript_12944/g.24228  ORF Transcript_12944/g.24228 Transcript_12944/m.24228 type:complete len:87 (+) Transcript_12944:124-384(+)